MSSPNYTLKLSTKAKKDIVNILSQNMLFKFGMNASKLKLSLIQKKIITYFYM